MKLKAVVQSGIVLAGLLVLFFGMTLVGIGRYGFALYAVVGGLVAWCAWLGFSAVSSPQSGELPEILGSVTQSEGEAGKKTVIKSELS